MKLLGLKLSGAGLGTGIAVGAGAVILGPVLLPMAGIALKKVTKAAVKGGVIAYGSGKIIAADAKEKISRLKNELREGMENLAAEARSEMAAAAAGGAAVKSLPGPADVDKKEKNAAEKNTAPVGGQSSKAPK